MTRYLVISVSKGKPKAHAIVSSNSKREAWKELARVWQQENIEYLKERYFLLNLTKIDKFGNYR